MKSHLGAIVGAAFVALALSGAARAQDQEAEAFKTQIDAFVKRIEPSTNGVVRWTGSDPYQITREGSSLVAVIANARLGITAPEPAELSLDRIEVRQIGKRENGKLVELAVVLPKAVTLTESDGSLDKLTLTNGKAGALLESDTGRGRETSISLDGARFEHGQTGAWVSFGPIAMASKLTPEANGDWSGPVSFEMTKLEFFFPQGPVSGTLDRLGYSGKSSGSNWDALQALRAEIDRLNESGPSPEERLNALLQLLPKMKGIFRELEAEFGLDGLTVRLATGEPMVGLASQRFAVALTGLSADTAAFRLTIRHDGLHVAPMLADETKIPVSATLDIGLEDISTEIVGQLLQLAGKMRDTGDPNDSAKGLAAAQMMGAVAQLAPTFRVYSIAFETKDVGLDATGEVKGSPLSPKGYAGSGRVAIRGFAALEQLVDGVPLAEYLPILQVIGNAETAAGGERLVFQLASAPQKWLTLNGNDITPWFKGGDRPGQPRLLKPADPPMQGEDVRQVQKALASARLQPGADGVYDGPTAAAVARFQKQNRLNVDGVVDPPTRQKLGLK